MRVKTPMGLGRFQVRFFSEEKFTKFDLAPKELITKLLQICLHTDCNAFNDITEEFCFCQNSYGNTTRLKIFYTSKKISLPFHRQAKQELKIKVAQN